MRNIKRPFFVLFFVYDKEKEVTSQSRVRNDEMTLSAKTF